MGYSIFDQTMVDMPWPEIEKAAKEGALVLLPVGIIEEHGPHLGLAVDTYVAYCLSVLTQKALEARSVRALVAPPQYWGVSAGTAIFPGTFSLRRETMKALLYDILGSLRRWGFKRVFAVNWHADFHHCQAVLEALKDARKNMEIDARYIMPSSDLRRLRLNGDEDHILITETPPMGKPKKYIDLHAGALETGIMAQFFPEAADLKMAKKLKDTGLTFDDLKALGRSDEETRKIIPQGYFGDPAGFSKEFAKQYVEETAKSYAEAIEGHINK